MLVTNTYKIVYSAKGELILSEISGELSQSALGGQREIIDQIDSQLVELLGRRAQASLAVAAIKYSAGLPIYVEGREDEVIASVHELNSGPYTNMQLTKLFLLIMGESRKLQDEYIRQQELGDNNV